MWTASPSCYLIKVHTCVPDKSTQVFSMLNNISMSLKILSLSATELTCYKFGSLNYWHCGKCSAPPGSALPDLVHPEAVPPEGEKSPSRHTLHTRAIWCERWGLSQFPVARWQNTTNLVVQISRNSATVLETTSPKAFSLNWDGGISKARLPAESQGENPFLAPSSCAGCWRALVCGHKLEAATFKSLPSIFTRPSLLLRQSPSASLFRDTNDCISGPSDNPGWHSHFKILNLSTSAKTLFLPYDVTLTGPKD